MVRVCPLLDWDYHDIWAYIAAHEVPCCSLYSRGYTSIGAIGDTIPNPHLAVPGTNPVQYQHAAYLTNGKWERAGRNVFSSKL